MLYHYHYHILETILYTDRLLYDLFYALQRLERIIHDINNQHSVLITNYILEVYSTIVLISLYYIIRHVHDMHMWYVYL